MEITYEKIRSTKTRVRIAFIAALLGALLGGAAGLYWRAYLISPGKTAAAVDFLLNFAGYYAGKWTGLWALLGAGVGANTPAQVTWAANTYRVIGERGWAATIHDWQAIGWCAGAGAAVVIALLGLLAKPAGKSFSSDNSLSSLIKE